MARYAITDGGVTPWPYKIHAISKEIKERDSDVVALSEVFDIQAALRLYEELKDEYAHFYFNMGAVGLGVSSGIFVESKFKIDDPKFLAFPKEALDGRGKNPSKCVFSFGLESEGKNFAHIFTTHLQHSEIPKFPTKGEVLAREKEMGIIVDKVDQIRNGAVIVTGDLNLGDNEYDGRTLNVDLP